MKSHILNKTEILSKLGKLSVSWQLIDNALIKEFNFHNFKEVINFFNYAAEISQEHNHHPTFSVTYDTVKLTILTHEASGITQKDIDLILAIEENNEYSNEET